MLLCLAWPFQESIDGALLDLDQWPANVDTKLCGVRWYGMWKNNPLWWCARGFVEASECLPKLLFWRPVLSTNHSYVPLQSSKREDCKNRELGRSKAERAKIKEICPVTNGGLAHASETRPLTYCLNFRHQDLSSFTLLSAVEITRIRAIVSMRLIEHLQ